MRAVTALTLLLSASHAHADATDLVSRSFVLPRGGFEARLTLEYSLFERMVGEPIALAPDVWVGVTEQLTIGIIHSSQSVDRIATRSSFCLVKSDLLCDATYQGSGIDVRYQLRDAPISVAPRTRVLLRDVDPWKPAVTLGALVRWTHGRFSITTDPFLRLGLANRDKGNRAAFTLPLWFGVQPGRGWLVEIHTGAEGDLAVLRDGWHMPFGIVFTARATRCLDAFLEVGMNQVYGPQTDTKHRAALLGVAWRGSLLR
ncbi:MAG TPA: hypothetical protein VK427_06635 [Kofleriaceae bacterium]|nr:hypothetical protein [Kofleriaceae bacterium]